VKRVSLLRANPSLVIIPDLEARLRTVVKEAKVDATSFPATPGMTATLPLLQRPA